MRDQEMAWSDQTHAQGNRFHQVHHIFYYVLEPVTLGEVGGVDLVSLGIGPLLAPLVLFLLIIWGARREEMTNSYPPSHTFSRTFSHAFLAGTPR